MTIDRDRYVKAALSLVGTPFVHAGRSPRGVDCVGLVILSAWECGLLSGWDDVDYGPTVSQERLISTIEMFCHRTADAWKPAQLLLFGVSGSAQHVGITTKVDGDCWRFVHAYQTLGRVVEQRLDEAWSTRLVERFDWGKP